MATTYPEPHGVVPNRGPILVQTQSGRTPANTVGHTLAYLAEPLLDTVTIIAAQIAAYALYDRLGVGKRMQYAPHSLFACAGLSAFLFVLLLERTGTYRAGSSLLRVRETEYILKATIQTACITLGAAYLFHQQVPRWLLSLNAVLVFAALLVQKNLVHGVHNRFVSRGRGVERVLIYGAGPMGRRLFSAFVRSPKLRVQPLALVDDDGAVADTQVYESNYTRLRSVPVLRGPLTKELIRRSGADRVVVAIPSVSKEKFLEIANEARASGVAISFVPYHFGASILWTEFVEIDGVLLASLKPSSSSRDAEFTKRFVDLAISGSLLVLLAPLICTVALAIKLGSPGPALFVQDRVGRLGRVFRIYKFRTMHVDAPGYCLSPKDGSDPRITPIGRFLRRTSLDELPQLVNVLKGDMSLVGPRPEMPFIVDSYQPFQRQRLEVKPGITGLWQLSADRAYLIHENIEYDLYYIRNRNFFMDLAVLLHTVAFAARGV